ncbi:MAG: hypothetical protein IJE10_06165 [Clostridia bacterium]|nr:hypothetical protein [Clostridia bacterium]
MSEIEKTIENTVASVEMEGYRITAEQKESCLAFASGKISKEEFIQKALERCKA